MTKQESAKEKEQKHLDEVLALIKTKDGQLKKSIKEDRNQARDLNAHFFDHEKLDYDNYSTRTCTSGRAHAPHETESSRRPSSM